MSISPSQSLSWPSQVSAVSGKTGHLYSQPSSGLLFASAKPESHLSISQPVFLSVHCVPLGAVVTHFDEALGRVQVLPHLPQLSTSFQVSTSSSTSPSQSSSLPQPKAPPGSVVLVPFGFHVH